MLEDSVSETNGQHVVLEAKYKLIDAHLANKLWLTISPKPIKGLSCSDIIYFWERDFATAFKLCDHFILVYELNEKDQLHFHIFCSFDVIHRKITFSKVWINKWYFDSIIKPIWARAPKLLCPYLTKQYDYMLQYLDGITDPYITDINALHNVFGLTDSD